MWFRGLRLNALARALPAVSGTILARLVVLAVGLLTSVITARALGPDGRGKYFAVVTLAGVIAQVGNLGVSSSNTYIAAREPAVSWGLLVNGLWICVLTGVVTSVGLAVFDAGWAARFEVDVGLLWPVALLGPAVLGFTYASSILAANLKFGTLNLWQVINAVLAMLVLSACAYFGTTVQAFVLATTFAALVAMVGASMSIARRQGETCVFSAPLFRRSVGFAARAYLALLFGYLLQRVAVGFLAAYARPEDLGHYSVASQIYDVLIIAPSSIGLVLFPTLLKQDVGRRETTIKALGVTMMLILAACSLLAWVGDWVIPAVFGRDFAPSYAVMLWLLPAALLISAVTVLSQYIVSSGFPSVLVLVWAAGLVACAAVSAPLIARHGAVGAAVSQSIGAAVVCGGVLLIFLMRPVGNDRLQPAG